MAYGVYGPFHHGLAFQARPDDPLGMVTCAISKSSPAPWLPKRPKKQCFIGWGCSKRFVYGSRWPDDPGKKDEFVSL